MYIDTHNVHKYNYNISSTYYIDVINKVIIGPSAETYYSGIA